MRARHTLALLCGLALASAGCGDPASTPAAPAASSSPGSAMDTRAVATPDEPPPPDEPALPRAGAAVATTEHTVPESEPAATEQAATAPPTLAAPPRAGEVREIPAGTVLAGTRPGLLGRSPVSEADLISVEVPAFSIDRLPFPNDPAQPPNRGLSRAEASRQCASVGKRLCHELEWERACEGDAGERPLAAGVDLDACRAEPRRCAAPFDVLSLGFNGAEWTASDDPRREAEQPLAVYRGARADAEPARQRCGARGASALSTTSPHIGFRCCGGPAPELSYPSEPARARFRDVEADAEALRRVLASVPELARYAPSFRPLDAERAQVPLRRAGVDTDALHGWELVTGVLRWTPAPGEHVWVISGTTEFGALLAVVHPLDDARFVHGASFLLEGDPQPIAVAYTPPSRRELQWSAVWGSPGEGGSIEYRDDEGRVVIVHH